MNCRLLVILFTLLFGVAIAQNAPMMDSIKTNFDNATTPGEKVKWLAQLSALNINLNNELADQYSKQLFEIAELSRDRKVMLEALLLQANSFYSAGGVKNHAIRAKKYSEQALKLAKSNQLSEYEAWAYLALAKGARNDGVNDKALNYNNLALSIASSSDNDSLKVSAHNSLGTTYLLRKDKLLAFRSYLQALNIAEDIKRYYPLLACYHNLAAFYTDLEEYEKAKDYLFKAFNLSVRYKKPYDRLQLYNTIGTTYVLSKNYDLAKDFYERSMKLADTLKFPLYKLNAYGKIVDMYFASQQAEKALLYFKEKKELRDFMTNAGVEFYIHHAYGIAYTSVHKFDSARYYFQLAEKGFETKADRYNRYFFYSNYAEFFMDTENHQKALSYWLKAKSIGDERGDISMLKTISLELDSTYQKLGDFKNAYHYNREYHRYKDSLQTMEAEKDLLALEVDNENRRKDKEIVAAETAKRERHNIQYMGITVGIAGVFVVLVMLGIFSVSKTTIRILGFFAFIFLFEFIILLADNEIHHWTHGEPWKILGIKIGLISVLLPLHHFLEEKVIHYLTSRKMLEVNPKELLSKMTRKAEPDPA